MLGRMDMTGRSPGHPKRESPLGRAIRSAPFRRLLIAQTVSRWGDTFSSVALVILVFQLTGSGIRVAGVVALEIAPVLMLGLFAGAIADRLPRRRVMIAADLARAAVAAGLVVFHEHLTVVYVSAFLLSAFSVFFNPAASSAVPHLVEERDIVGANSALWSAAVLSQIVLAPVAGVVVATAGPGPAFLLNSISFVVSAAFLIRLALPATAVQLRRISRWAEATEGARHVASDPLLRVLAWVQVAAALSAGATSALLVVLASKHLDVGPARFGLLIGAIGVGAGIGPLVLQRFVDDVRRPVWLFGPYVLRGVVDLVLAAFRSFPLALGALAVYGVGTSTGMVTYNSTLHTTVPDNTRGRVFAVFDVVWQSGRLLSLLLGGWAADRYGIRAVYVIGGSLLLGAGIYGILAAPRTSPSVGLENR